MNSTKNITDNLKQIVKKKWVEAVCCSRKMRLFAKNI